MTAPTLPTQGTIVILTGAGISQESGQDTFRDPGGIWSKVRLEDVATPEGFARDPQQVHRFYNGRRRALFDSLPNAAHAALARLERDWPERVLVVTQNIDDLHERAGTRTLIHMHGELRKVRCTACDGLFTWEADLDTSALCPTCRTLGSLRPHVVWFGEVPLALEDIYAALTACALFVSIGTSGQVYPAADFVDLVQSYGKAHTVELNLEPSSGASSFDEAHYGPATRIVPEFVERLLSGGLCPRPPGT